MQGIYMIDNWHDLKRLYLKAFESDPSIPVDQHYRTVQHKGCLWWHIISIWSDGKTTGEYIPLHDSCEPEIVF